MERVGHCIDQILVLKWTIMTNVITDLIIFPMPIPTVWRLNMRLTERIAVISCFVLGLAYATTSCFPYMTIGETDILTVFSCSRCCIIGCVRFWQISSVNLIGNLTGTSLTSFVFCTVELMLAGLCINIPMLQSFYQRYRAKYKSSQSSGIPSQVSSSQPQEGQQAPSLQPNRGDYSAWIELVCSCSFPINLCPPLV